MPGFAIEPGKAAIVITDPQNDFLSPDGVTWGVVGHASINEAPISENERKFNWPLGRRPDEHASLSQLGL